MDRSRYKRYNYDQDYDHIETLPRTKQRYNNNNNYSGGGGHYGSNYHHQQRNSSGGGGGRKALDPSSPMVTTSYRILCHDAKAGGVIGKSGSIIKAIRQHTGAWINVHELMPGDEERIIEISDTRRRDPDGRMPSFSPAQDALFMIHERILESDGGGYTNGYGGGEDDDDSYGPRGGAGMNKVVTRLVVARIHVGSLLGKAGKIIEQMRMETKTHIRVLPRDHTLPRCVAMSEEIVQIVGEKSCVKNAIAIISSRLRESQHRDRGHIHGRPQSPDQFFPPEDDYLQQPNRILRRQSLDGPTYGINGIRNNNIAPYPLGYTSDHVSDNNQSLSREDLVFQILCPNNKVDCVIHQSDGIIDLLRNEIGVDVKVADLGIGSDEQIIIVSSDEGPDDKLFPAQEAVLHIQTRIADLVPEKENIITTRLLLSAGEIRCLEGRDGLSEMKRMTGASIQILSGEEVPKFVSFNDELVQIVGEIKAAREALMEVTSRLRNYQFQEFFQKDTLFAPSPGGASNFEAVSSNNMETYSGNDTTIVSSQNVQSTTAPLVTKNNGGPRSEAVKQSERDTPSGTNRITMPLVTRSILEVVIPQYAVPKLITKSKNKLSQISELSGANVKLVDDGPETKEHLIQISGTPEQAERAQSLLQGFILSTQEDGP